jgi:hypothetical protein
MSPHFNCDYEGYYQVVLLKLNIELWMVSGRLIGVQY